jgi:putative salt-induced outer membrane protein YdiY
MIARVRVLVLFCVSLGALPAAAEEAAGNPWTHAVEFSFVLTSGNSETLSLGFDYELEGKWERQAFELKLGALRVEDTERDRFAVGSADDFTVESTEDSELTAEAYEVGMRYDRKFSERNDWFVGGSWYRNEVSGISNRTTGVAGIATRWKEGERARFRTDAGLTWTHQGDLIESPSRDDSWAGFRFGWELWTKVGRNGEYGNELGFDLNFGESDDSRLDLTNWFAAAITERLSLKVSHRILWDGLPSLEEVDLYDPEDLGTPVDAVLVELDSVDTVLNASLVIRW